MNQTILVVDDDKTLCELHAKFFEMAGFQVLKAYSGFEAIEMIENNSNIAVIISDVRMKNGDGIFILEQTQKMGFDVPKIMISGYTDVSEKKLKELGAFAFLEKPVKPKELLSRLKGIF